MNEGRRARRGKYMYTTTNHICFVGTELGCQQFLVFFWPKPAPPRALTRSRPACTSTPACPTPIGSPLPQNEPAHISLAKTEPPRLGFCFFGLNQPPLAPHPLAPSLHLNPSVPRLNRVPSTQKPARPHFDSQNRASTARFLLFWPKPAPSRLTLSRPPCTSIPAYPALIGSPLPKYKPARTSIAKTEPPRLDFWFFWPKPALPRASPDCALSPPQPQRTPPQWSPLYSICRSLVGMVSPGE